MSAFPEPSSAAFWPSLALLFVVGAVASAVNAVAGGGTLLSFPVLVASGLPPLLANATNAVALWPGSLAGAVGFLPRLREARRRFLWLGPPTVFGALLGAWLLTRTNPRAFAVAVPILLGLATLLLALQPRFKAIVESGERPPSPVLGGALQGLVAVYGGYFGAGMGVLMLGVYGLFLSGTLHEHNAVKAWLGLAINLVASVVFVLEGLVEPWPGLAMAFGAIVGGYWAARSSQRIDPDRLRRAVVGLGVVLTVVFALRV